MHLDSGLLVILNLRVFNSCIAVSPQWDAMKLSLMIEEANKISAKLRKNTVFSRYRVQHNTAFPCLVHV